jgi:hypothetical protein
MWTKTMKGWAAFFCIAASAASATEYYGVTVDQTQLGQGFDNQVTMFREHCITGDIVETGNTEGELSYTGSNTVERHMEETFGKVKGGINLIIFAGSVSTSLSSQVTDNTRTASSSVKLIYDARDLSLENRTLTPLGTSILGDEDFRVDATCGNEFVHHVKLGSEIYVNARLYFRSVEDYKKWVTKIKVRFLFYSKTKTKTKEWYDLTENGVYSIDVVTRGGMTDRLQTILDTNPTYCKTESMDACIDTAGKIFDYLFDEAGYPQDIKSAPKQVVSFTTESYANSGHFELVKPAFDKGTQFGLEEEKLQVRLHLNHDIRNSYFAFAQVEDDETLKEQMLVKVGYAEENIAALDAAATTCRETLIYATCHQAVENAIAIQHVIDF